MGCRAGFEIASASSDEAGNHHDEGSQQKCNPRQEAKGFVAGSAGANIFLHMQGVSKLKPKYPRRKQIRIMRTNSKRNNGLGLKKPGRELAIGESVPKIKQVRDPTVLN